MLVVTGSLWAHECGKENCLPYTSRQFSFPSLFPYFHTEKSGMGMGSFPHSRPGGRNGLKSELYSYIYSSWVMVDFRQLGSSIADTVIDA